MEDEEEGLSLLSLCHGRSLANAPVEERTTPDRTTAPPTDSPVLSSAVVVGMPLLQTTPRCRVMASDPDAVPPSGRTRSLQRSLHGTVGLGLVSTPTATAEDTRALLHSLIFFPEGDPEFGTRFLSVPELPNAATEEEEQWQEEEVKEEEVGRPEEKDEEERPGASVEVQIGRKLREIGDQFHEEHLQLFLQYQRGQLLGWWHIAVTLYNFLFPVEEIGPGGGHR
ncbi:BCL2 modifying factor 2 [Brachyhypopomus gauderio]|uniref:BCL2 modifying factor 2 n=1 Tax=Brachyhypopomus gauderio TaxID=698409 RepID=UPI004042BD2B